MREQVRDATPADGGRVDELLAAALGGTEAAPSSDKVPVGQGKAASHVLVGQLDDAVVGVAVVSTQAAGREHDGLVHLVYVEPGAREVGVGGLLLEAAVHWARAQGCTQVDALARPGDRQTKRLLEAGGFKTRQLRMRLGQEKEPPAS